MPEQAFDSKEVKKSKAPTMFIELCDQRDSGWVLDGTQNTQHEVRLSAPSAKFISNKGFRLVKNADGEWVNEAIRYIKNCPVLSVEEQNKRGFKPAKNKMEDLIIVKNGNATITREGKFTALYDYLQAVFYNSTNPNRPDSAQDVFRVVELGKKEEQVNEKKLAIAEAIQFIGTLYVKQGKEFRYSEDKINSLCQIFLVYAETLSGKINGLMAHAEKNPEDFLNKALRFSQTIEMEIGHALELSVVKFEGNTLVYCNKDKVVFDLGRGNIKQAKKIAKSAELFGTNEYKAAYEEFTVELEVAKENQFKA